MNTGFFNTAWGNVLIQSTEIIIQVKWSIMTKKNLGRYCVNPNKSEFNLEMQKLSQHACQNLGTLFSPVTAGRGIYLILVGVQRPEGIAVSSSLSPTPPDWAYLKRMKALNVSGGVEIMIRVVSYETGCVNPTALAVSNAGRGAR